MNLYGFEEQEAERILEYNRRFKNEETAKKAKRARMQAKLEEIREDKWLSSQIEKVCLMVTELSYDISPDWLQEELEEAIACELAEDEYENEPDPYEGWYEQEAEKVYRGEA